MFSLLLSFFGSRVLYAPFIRIYGACQAQNLKEQEQSEAQPDGAWGATEQTGTNGIFREPFRLKSYRGYGR
jgi:hypothetical protein